MLADAAAAGAVAIDCTLDIVDWPSKLRYVTSRVSIARFCSPTSMDSSNNKQSNQCYLVRRHYVCDVTRRYVTKQTKNANYRPKARVSPCTLQNNGARQ